MYRALNAQSIIKTIEELEARIEERFPGAGLARVCSDLTNLARQTTDRIRSVSRPHWLMRTSLAAAVLAAISLLIYLVSQAQVLKGTDQLSEVMQGLDAAMNLIVILGGAAFFISTLEARWNRGRALDALHELRSIIHVIDMHQLTKDPSMLGAARTSASPDHDLTPFELTRYLDYCSEMLSLTAKLAALYAEKLNDAIVIDTVGDIERLTSSLSSKIWQKISMVQAFGSRDVLPPNMMFMQPTQQPAPLPPPASPPVKPPVA